jgi:hypothetical protein
MAPLERVDGEFQGKTFVVRLGHLGAEPDEQQGAPKCRILEFGGKRSMLMVAGPGDKSNYVSRRAEERLLMLYG